MKRLFHILALLLIAPLLLTAQTLTLPSKYGTDWAVLPGSVRHIHATITGGTTNEVNWSISGTTGGATASLSATTAANPWVDVTIGSTAGTCSITGSVGSYVVTSTATVTLTAQSVDNTASTASITFAVCAPTTSVVISPFYRVLYASQPAELQSWVLGNTNENVTWAITAQPTGGDGALVDTANRDTVFSATVAGRYTVTATSAADNTKTATTTLYVSGTAMPYAQTASSTEPVDCEVDPNETGTDYEVGPSQAYTTIGAALTALYNTSQTSWAGSTVRVHNEDTTGTNPTTYHEYIQIKGSGTATQPFRICGVPDSVGHLPVIDANASTGQAWVSTGACSGYSAVCVWPGPSNPYGLYQSGPIPTAYVVIEGLSIKNASAPNTYTSPSGTAETWGDADCIGSRAGSDQEYIGNEISFCGDGVFTDFQASHAWMGFQGHDLIEGNYIHDNGVNGSFIDHQLYIQGWLQVAQFNIVDKMVSGAAGSNLKDRGVGTIIRYNYFGDGETANSPARVIDSTDNQDSSDYMTLDVVGGASGVGYLGVSGNTTCTSSWYCQGDTLGADGVTAWNEMWHDYDVYGNVIQNSVANWVQHYMSDHGASDASRQGTAEFYDNTLNLTTTNGYGVLDTDDNSGGTPNEYPEVNAENNIIWQSPGTSACWNRVAMLEGGFTTNIISSGALDNIGTLPIPSSYACNTDSGWQGSSTGNITPFTLTSPISAHLTGISSANFLATSTQPFQSTYAPVVGQTQNGTILAGPIAALPVRYQFTPSIGYYSARLTPVTSTNGGIVGAVDNVVTYTLSTATAGNGSGTITGCAGSYAQNQSYTCTVTPASGSFIYSVAGCGGSGTTSYSGLMPAANCTVTATFDLLPGSVWEGMRMQGVSVH